VADTEHVLGVHRGVIGGAAGGDDDRVERSLAQRGGDSRYRLAALVDQPARSRRLLTDLIPQAHRSERPQGKLRIIPPSTPTTIPFTYDAAGDRRKAATRPTSAGSP
jgi:hypothetical protein